MCETPAVLASPVSRGMDFDYHEMPMSRPALISHQRTSYRAEIELNLTLALMSKSNLNYSARNACMGLILVARLAGNHAAAMVISATATMEMEMATGSSGLSW
jgi:hypothetical protein